MSLLNAELVTAEKRVPIGILHFDSSSEDQNAIEAEKRKYCDIYIIKLKFSFVDEWWHYSAKLVDSRDRAKSS